MNKASTPKVQYKYTNEEIPDECLSKSVVQKNGQNMQGFQNQQNSQNTIQNQSINQYNNDQQHVKVLFSEEQDCCSIQNEIEQNHKNSQSQFDNVDFNTQSQIKNFTQYNITRKKMSKLYFSEKHGKKILHFNESEKNKSLNSKNHKLSIYSQNQNQPYSSRNKMVVSSRQSPRFSLNKQRNVLTAKSANSISVISDEDYFVQDSYNLNDSRSKEYDIEKIQKKKNYFLTFRPSIFLEFAFYHLLFYLILGPLTILLLKIKPGTNLMKNLQFYGKGRYALYVQLTLFFFNMFIFTCYFVLNFRNFYFFGELIYVVISILLRLSSICIKYATYDNYQILTVKHKVLTVEDIRQETLLLSWYHQTTPIIYNETSFQLRRHEIIESMFYITFMKKPKKKLIEKLQKNTEELQLFNSKQYKKPRPLGELIRDDLYIDCQGVIKKLVDHFHKIKDSVRNKQLAIGFLYPLIRIIIPYITRLYEGKQVFGGNGYEVSCMIMSTLIQYYAFLSLNMIVLMGIYDINRKNYFMEQLAYILSPRRIGITDSLKLLPSINLFSQVNLKGWMLLRKVLFDYGYKFVLREQLNLTLIVCVVLIGIPVQLLSTFGLIDVDNSFTIALLLDISYFSILILIYLYFSAKVNYSYDLHAIILRENKAIIDDMYRNRKLYFQKGYKSNNYLYNVGIKYLSKNFQISEEQEIIKILRDLQKSYQEYIAELKNDKIMYPLKLLGIVIRGTVLKSIAFGLISIIGTVTISQISSW